MLAQLLGDDGADAGIVVADEDGAVAALDRRGDRARAVRRRRRGRSARAATHSVVPGPCVVGLRPDGAAVLLHDAAADGEAEAGAALLAGVGGFDLLEAIEDGFELVRRECRGPGRRR